MFRAALVGVTALSLALAPKACTKQQKPSASESDFVPPPPVPSATTPPIWAPPQGPGAPSTAATSVTPPPPPPASPELVKARAAADAKEFKKVKAILEKKVKAGRAAPEENQLLFRACVQLKDKACADAVKSKHPEDIASLGDGS